MGTLISQNVQYSGATLSQQSTPIGAIIPYMGTTAPSGYLACDGGVYSISLYPLLAGFFEAQFGSINYFGGDGVTTFAVPNLQGEFIRGAGTNSHSNQGSGGSVGEHQDGTESVYMGLTGNSNLWTIAGNTSDGNSTIYPKKCDAVTRGTVKGLYINASGTNSTAADAVTYTSRPTNTSVLYIIKAKSDRLDKITFAEVDDASEADDVVWSGEKISSEINRITEYSTSEKVVGKWIDGKKIYQKTIAVTAPSTSTDGTFAISYTEVGVGNLGAAWIAQGFWNVTSAVNNNFNPVPLMVTNAQQHLKLYISNTGRLQINNNSTAYNGTTGYVTIQYTKTTD